MYIECITDFTVILSLTLELLYRWVLEDVNAIYKSTDYCIAKNYEEKFVLKHL